MFSTSVIRSTFGAATRRACADCAACARRTAAGTRLMLLDSPPTAPYLRRGGSTPTPVTKISATSPSTSSTSSNVEHATGRAGGAQHQTVSMRSAGSRVLPAPMPSRGRDKATFHKAPSTVQKLQNQRNAANSVSHPVEGLASPAHAAPARPSWRPSSLGAPWRPVEPLAPRRASDARVEPTSPWRS